jgi:hypothetical protein
MKVKTLFWRNTTSMIDAHDLYSEISKAIMEDTEITIQFRDNISWLFAKEIMELLRLGDIEYDKIKRFVKLKGFKDLEQYSWNNMTSAKMNAEYASKYENHFGYGYGCLDGW